jgi:hypothetical protein
MKTVPPTASIHTAGLKKVVVAFDGENRNVQTGIPTTSIEKPTKAIPTDGLEGRVTSSRSDRDLKFLLRDGSHTVTRTASR